MNDMPESEVLEREVVGGSVAVLDNPAIDRQIATAHRFPRSITAFRQEALQMVTLTEGIAQECMYALKREGKVIEGPSARFAEIVVSAWGNSRAATRIARETDKFIVAQAEFFDLQRNVAIQYEVQRRITNKEGRRYGDDMIGVTANAACSIALRNAILKGVPKAFWSDIYSAARKVAIGDVKTLANKRADAIKAFQAFGVSQEQILAKLERAGVADITIDDLGVLFGLLTAMKDGDSTPEQLFAPDEPTDAEKARAALRTKKPAGDSKPAATEAKAPPPAAEPPQGDPDAIAKQITAAKTGDALDVATDLIATAPPDQQARLLDLAKTRRAELAT